MLVTHLRVILGLNVRLRSGAVPAKNPESSEKSWQSSRAIRNVPEMLALTSTLFSWFGCRVRSRAELERELIALRHQVVGRAARPRA